MCYIGRIICAALRKLSKFIEMVIDGRGVFLFQLNSNMSLLTHSVIAICYRSL